MLPWVSTSTYLPLPKITDRIGDPHTFAEVYAVVGAYVMGFFDAFRGLGMVCRAPVSYESLASVTADIIRTTEEKELMIAVALAHERLGCRFPGKGGAK